MICYSQDMNLEWEGAVWVRRYWSIEQKNQCPAAAAIKYIFQIYNSSIPADHLHATLIKAQS
jgi:hypothetical protein